MKGVARRIIVLTTTVPRQPIPTRRRRSLRAAAEAEAAGNRSLDRGLLRRKAGRPVRVPGRKAERRKVRAIVGSVARRPLMREAGVVGWRSA